MIGRDPVGLGANPNSSDQDYKWQRRENKRRNSRKMKVTGAGNKLLARLIAEKGEDTHAPDDNSAV